MDDTATKIANRQAGTLAAALDEMICSGIGYTRERFMALADWEREWLMSGYELHHSPIRPNTSQIYRLWDVRLAKYVAGVEFSQGEMRHEGESYVFAQTVRRLDM